MSAPSAAGDPAAIETLTKALEGISEKIDGVANKNEVPTLKDVETLTKAVQDVRAEIGEIRDRSLDKPGLGLPFKDGLDFMHTFLIAQMPGKPGHEDAKKAIFGDGGYVKRVEEKYKAPSGFHTQGQEGEYFIIPEYSRDLIRTPGTRINVRSLARQFNMSGNFYSMNALVDKNHQTSVTGGLNVAWTPEGGAFTPSTTEFEKIEFRPNKLTGGIYITEEMDEDSVAFATLFPGLFAEEMDNEEETVFLGGNGVGKPLGALATQNPALVSVARTTGGTLKPEDALKMKARAYMPNWGKYVWVAEQSIITALPTWTIGAQPVYMSSARTGQDVDLLLGRPIIYSDSRPVLGSAGDLSLVDFSQYAIANKGGLKQQESLHVRFLYGERTLRFVKRLDGKPLWRAPLTPKNGSSATRSPFITLAA